MLTVRDQGPGDLPHVFERFYRAAATRPMPGSGLGLAIVKQIVDNYGGAVSASARTRWRHDHTAGSARRLTPRSRKY